MSGGRPRSDGLVARMTAARGYISRTALSEVEDARTK